MVERVEQPRRGGAELGVGGGRWTGGARWSGRGGGWSGARRAGRSGGLGVGERLGAGGRRVGRTRSSWAAAAMSQTGRDSVDGERERQGVIGHANCSGRGGESLTAEGINSGENRGGEK